MFRSIRKKKNEIGIEESKKLLHDARRGILAVNGDNHYPYAIPVNYFYDEENQKIYFHGSRVGHKVDALKICDKVCFTVFGNETVKEESWGTVSAERCHIRTLSFGRRSASGNGIAKTVCNEILP